MFAGPHPVYSDKVSPEDIHGTPSAVGGRPRGTGCNWPQHTAVGNATAEALAENDRLKANRTGSSPERSGHEPVAWEPAASVWQAFAEYTSTA